MSHSSTSYQHWRITTDANSIVWLEFDMTNSNTNTLGKETLHELEQIITELATRKPTGLVISSAKRGGFIAGADVNEFTRITSEEEAYQLARRGQLLFNAIEALQFPTVALIHGYCMGGGTELALACRYRIALDDDNTRIGLPEIRLGIHPGFGGTVRMLKLLGPLAAMPLMLTGRSLRVKQAKRMGVVDHCVPERLWKQAAQTTVLRRPKPKKASWLQRLPNLPGLRNILARIMRKKAARHALPEHYPAPNALLNLWENPACTQEDCYAAEARSVGSLIVSPTAQNLVRLFFLQNRLKALGKKQRDPLHIHVIGGGTMGMAIASWCALRGHTVTVQEPSHEQLGKVVAFADKLFRKRLKQPRLVRDAHDRLTPDKEGHGIAKADVVIEAIVEQLERKQQVLAAAEARMKPRAILASNTSSIPLEQIANALARPEQFIGLHFFNPVDKMMLIEVVRSESSSEEALEKGMSFVGSIGKLPLPVKSSPGFLVNRILLPYLLEAITMVDEGIAPETIDKAAKQFGMPMGPVQLADMVGLDVCLLVANIFTEHYGFSVPARLQTLVRENHLGKKSNKGFYTYRKGKPVFSKQSSSTAKQLKHCADRLTLRILNESIACLREGIVEDADLLDAGMVFGTGFAPFRGGPMQYVRTETPEFITERINELSQTYGSRFVPDEGWKQIANMLAPSKESISKP